MTAARAADPDFRSDVALFEDVRDLLTHAGMPEALARHLRHRAAIVTERLDLPGIARTLLPTVRQVALDAGMLTFDGAKPFRPPCQQCADEAARQLHHRPAPREG